MKFIQFEYDSATAVISVDGRKARLVRVYSKELTKGHGSGVLDLVCRFADDNNLTLNVDVQRTGYSRNSKAMSNPQLIGWFKKFNFVIGRANPKPVTMYRAPEN